MTARLMVDLVTEECCVCGVPFGMTQQHHQARKRDGGWFYCPNGHHQHYTKSTEQKLEEAKAEADRLKKRLADSERWLQQEGERAKTAEKSLSAARGQITKLRKRAQAGTCPYCQRHFLALEAHVKCKHSDQPLPEEASDA